MASEHVLTILDLLAEGGTLTVIGRRFGSDWKYGIVVNERAFEDEGGSISETPLDSWTDVVAKLERYHWRNLHTEFVHPDFAERVQAAREAGPLIHERYLPHSGERLARHFVHITPDRRQLLYYEASADRYREHMAAASHRRDAASLQNLRLARQIEKDERFWTVAGFMALYHSDDRVRMFSELLEHAFGTTQPPIDLGSWRDCLEGDLRLYFEVDVPSPKAYREELRNRRAATHPIPYVRDVAARVTERALEGPTQVDALLVNPANGFTVFFESKVLSDTSCQVSFDPLRNQIARNIDAMLEAPAPSAAAVDSGAAAVAKRDPGRSLFVLLTPQVFHERRDSRLYGWLMNDYRNNPGALGRDLPHRQADWQAVSRRLGWTTFEKINAIRPGACGWLS